MGVEARLPVSFRVAVGLQPTHRNESHRVRHPRESGGPCRNKLDSRFRGNDVTFGGAQRGISLCAFGWVGRSEQRIRARFLAALGMTQLRKFARNDSAA
jgi:hypothetical protein